MTVASGIVAALTAPFLLDVGFIIWDKHWEGSSFALNLYKCSLASIGFLILSLVTRPPGLYGNDGPPFPPDIFTIQSVGFLMLSSTIGILIGDWTWLEALQIIGAKQVVLMDSIKPFLAAFFGWMILGERLAWPAFVGMALTVGGVVWVSFETEKPTDDEGVEDEGSASINVDEARLGDKSESIDHVVDTKDGDAETSNPENSELRSSNSVASKNWRKGYVLAVANVFLDTYGSLLTKQYGVGMSTWNISLIRFGFAAVFCLILSLILHLRDLMLKENKVGDKAKVVSDSTVNESAHHSSENIEAEATSDSINVSDRTRPWYSLPKMKWKSWFKISLGVAFVTFGTPALSNYALFQIALALALTLGSIGPVYMIPLSFALRRDRPTVRSCLGAVLAVAGVAVLSFFGQQPQVI